MIVSFEEQSCYSLLKYIETLKTHVTTANSSWLSKGEPVFLTSLCFPNEMGFNHKKLSNEGWLFTTILEVFGCLSFFFTHYKVFWRFIDIILTIKFFIVKQRLFYFFEETTIDDTLNLISLGTDYTILCKCSFLSCKI
jgi:hypothetical protein